MDRMITLFHESTEFAFFLGTLLYAMFFAGDLLVSRCTRTPDGPAKH
jgi:hypothetical protein